MGRLKVSFRRRGVHVKKHVRHLGVDYTPGRAAGRRLRPVAAARLKDAGVRKARVRKLGLTGRAINRIVRTGMLPAAIHGAGVTKLTNSQLDKLASLAHGAFGKASGRSAYARLLLSGGLAGATQAIQPIVDWSRAWFDSLMPHEVMKAAWRRAVHEVGFAEDPQAAVRGPAGAAVAAALRVGWKMTGPYVFSEPSGHLLDATVEAPTTIKRAALEGFDDWSAERSSLAKQVGGTPFSGTFGVFSVQEEDTGVH